MITVDDLRNARKNSMHIDGAKGSYCWIVSLPDYPRFSYKRGATSRGEREQAHYYVDGWEVSGLAEAAARLNEPPRDPPPPEKSLKEQLEERVKAIRSRGLRHKAAEIEKELRRELKFRYRVYAGHVEEGKLLLETAAQRIAMFEDLADDWAAKARDEAAKEDLFGGNNGNT